MAEIYGLILEGKGMTPDIVVENDPAREYAGIDYEEFVASGFSWMIRNIRAATALCSARRHGARSSRAA